MTIMTGRVTKKIHRLDHRTLRFRPGLNIIATLEDYWLKVAPGDCLTVPINPLKLDGMFLGATKTDIRHIRPELFKLMSPKDTNTTFDSLCDQLDRDHGRAGWDSRALVLVFFYIEPELVHASGIPAAIVESAKGSSATGTLTEEDTEEIEALRVRTVAYELQKPKVSVKCVRCGARAYFDQRYGKHQECLDCRPIRQRHPDASAQVYPKLTTDEFVDMLSKSGEAKLAKTWVSAQDGTNNAR